VTDELRPCERFVADCNTRLATDLLAHRWDPVLLAGLREGPRRRADLLAAVGDVSDKSLTESLRRLTASGLVTPTADATSRHVRYELTPLGASFVEGPLRALGLWAVEHGHEVVAAQERQPAHARR
jgi:DNA-binding HxlR family transcriptional regulator